MDWMWHVPMEVSMYNAAYTGCQINGIIWAFWNTCGIEFKSFKESGRGGWPSIFKRLKNPCTFVGKPWYEFIPSIQLLLSPKMRDNKTKAMGPCLVSLRRNKECRFT